MIPTPARPLFWDTSAEGFEPTAYPRYTIERVLEHGTEEDVAWLIRVFSRGTIADVLRTDQRLSPRSANFWALCFGVPPGEVAALQRR
jgi:hypothetical protein